MKKYLLIFLLLCAAAIVYLSFPINSKQGFVSIEDGKFKLNGKDFYPVAVNYIASVRTDGDEIWPSPYVGYTPDSLNAYVSKDSCLKQLQADMELIKEMGFNTIRFVNIGEEFVYKKTGELAIDAMIDGKKDISFSLSIDENYKKYFAALEELFHAANTAGLKIILLTRNFAEVYSTSLHLQKIATHFRNDTSILAYDLFNEPLYFDSLERKKEDVNPITKRWSKIIKMYAPNHLCTIGLAGIREIFEWDPNLLDVDFISFHPYNHEPEQVMNELYWYSKYVKKPWILGETAISADNDSITYEEQKQFAEKSLKQTYNCGGIGYSWWQYKDVEWYAYMANYMGVVTRTGTVKTNKSNLRIRGSIKPVADAFRKYTLPEKKDSCDCPPNYYNWSSHTSFRLTGILVDENDKPIEGGVFLAWNQNWSHSYHTITKADGSFELYGDFEFYHWIASASLYSMTRGEISPNTTKAIENIPTLNMGNIKLKRLSL